MTTITEFLLARITEDETVAREVSADRNGNFTGIELWAAETNGWVAVGASAERVLAECAAKRALLVLAEQIHGQIEGEWGGGRRISEEGWQDNDGTRVVQTLAAVYKDHPDYQQEWAL